MGESDERKKIWDSQISTLTSRTQDVVGKVYIDFIGMFSAVNTDTAIPLSRRLNKGMIGRVRKSVSSHLADLRCCQNYIGKSIISHFHLRPFRPKALYPVWLRQSGAMTSGTEAADTACEIARCWGINKKQIPAKDCVVLGVGDCYHGLASGVWGLMNSNPLRTTSESSPPEFSRCMLICDWEKKVCSWEPSPDEYQSQHGGVAGFSRPGEDEVLPWRAQVIMECIYGYKWWDLTLIFMLSLIFMLMPGTNMWLTKIRYARGVYELCKFMNILFIADEVRQGAGKTGKFFQLSTPRWRHETWHCDDGKIDYRGVLPPILYHGHGYRHGICWPVWDDQHLRL